MLNNVDTLFFERMVVFAFIIAGICLILKVGMVQTFANVKYETNARRPIANISTLLAIKMFVVMFATILFLELTYFRLVNVVAEGDAIWYFMASCFLLYALVDKTMNSWLWTGQSVKLWENVPALLMTMFCDLVALFVIVICIRDMGSYDFGETFFRAILGGSEIMLVSGVSSIYFFLVQMKGPKNKIGHTGA